LGNSSQNPASEAKPIHIFLYFNFVQDDIEIKLREEAMISRVLKEKLLSKELDIEQLQSDLAASVRVQEVLQSEIQRVQDELCCLTHKYKHLEVQVTRKP
jgi:hypothetical protein